MPVTRSPAPVAREWTPIILAIGLATGINAITIAVLIDALYSEGPGLSTNATQVLTTAFGGIIGVLGSALGYRTGRQAAEEIQGDSGDAEGTGPSASRKGATMSTTTPDPNEKPDQVTTPAEEVQPDEQDQDDDTQK